jgi:protein-S-isoprenylcysteine O-methyltransferase Ste14
MVNSLFGKTIMYDDIFQFLFFLGWILTWVVRWPSIRQSQRNSGVEHQGAGLDKLIIAILLLGGTIITFVYLWSPWLDFADYDFPSWGGWAGVVVFLIALWLLWRSHLDLGRNFSQDLEIKENHSLVTHGVYRHIRHPIYLAGWLIAFAQIALLHNWIAGLALLIAMLPMHLVRIPREEKMLLEQFGDEYREYMKGSGRVIPHFGRRNYDQ